MEYRQDDRTDVGYCPKCGHEVSGLTKELKGFCAIHGWVFVNFERPAHSGDKEESDGD